MTQKLVLVSHVLCPYVQRAAITLAEKKVAFERIDIDLANKPEWFLRVSPLGKTPVLLVDGVPVFESAVICEYLDDVLSPKLHPADPLLRARHRSWIEFASATLNGIGAFYGAQDEKTLNVRVAELGAKFRQLEAELSSADHAGPFFGGDAFSLVDAAFAPVFRYFDVFDRIADFGVFTDTPHVRQWRNALRERPSVRSAVQENYPQLLRKFLLDRQSQISRLMRQTDTVAA